MIAALITILNTIFWCVLLYPFAILKVLLPGQKTKDWCSRQIVQVAECFIDVNSWTMDVTQKIKWDIRLPQGLSNKKNYLVCCNHQSWVDIIVLQYVLNRKIPFLRFFLKKDLLYVPLLGGAWWALDYPFMKRYSKEYLEKHPEKRGEDLRTTEKAMEKFKNTHFSMLNFLEGTRFTQFKHDKQNSPFRHLLIPKTGGFAFALSAMKDQLDSILDVTIVYPAGAVNMAQAMNGLLKEVVVHVREISVPTNLLNGNYLEDAQFRERMQGWVKNLWTEKDLLIEQILMEKAASNII
jgi:1-acyl-sn-glycerol-3-phosphate acyltransferase